MTCLSLLCIAMIKTLIKSNLGGKGLFFSQLAVHHEGKSEQEVGQESGGGD